MRLTLRTMLAFLDDILAPADAQDVSKKIEESEFATGLMHRMRDVTRRLRLGAPKLHGRGMGLDPNTVAEYLDNTLLSERVADFEKVCLESDVHLAEVAACHQVLALVLGEPAEIEATGRQRMYELISQPEATARIAAKDDRKLRESAARSARKKKKRRRPKVPDYLREPSEAEPRSRRWAAMLAVAASLAAVGIGLATYYWPEISRRLQVAQIRVEPPDNTAATGAPPHDIDQPSAEPDGQSNGDSRAQAPPEEAAGRVENDAQTQQADVAGERPAQGRTTPESRQPPQVSDPAAESAAPATAPGDEPPGRSVKKRARQTLQMEVEEDASTENGDADAAEKEAPAAEGIGRLISPHEVLLRADENRWKRVPDNGILYASERLIALPTYRPNVAMSNGITLQLLGGAMVTLGATEEGEMQIRLDSGRLLLLTVAKPDVKIHLRAGDHEGTIEFGKEEASLALEVRHVLPEGADPEEEPTPTTVDLYLASGQVTWTDRQGRSDALRGRVHRSLGKAKAQPSEELPVWIEASELNPTERRAATEVESFLRADKPVGPALTELATHRKIENSLLATQSLALLDEFEPMVPLLNDKAYRIAWTSQIESLRSSLARGPKSAALVREAFEAVRGKKLGDQLYRMLLGYNAQQLEDGAAAQLIEWLDAPDEELDMRVLAFWNLHHITGLGLYYQPGDPENKRRTPIQRWKQKLESGLISPKAT